jgi:hypothetical protein
MEKQYKNMDERIKDLLKEGPLVALYFCIHFYYYFNHLIINILILQL